MDAFYTKHSSAIQSSGRCAFAGVGSFGNKDPHDGLVREVRLRYFTRESLLQHPSRRRTVDCNTHGRVLPMPSDDELTLIDGTLTIKEPRSKPAYPLANQLPLGHGHPRHRFCAECRKCQIVLRRDLRFKVVQTIRSTKPRLMQIVAEELKDLINEGRP